jgi:hypothetical protein
VNERRRRRHESSHVLLEGLAKDDALVVALLKANGVVAEKVECGDDLHISELAY